MFQFDRQNENILFFLVFFCSLDDLLWILCDSDLRLSIVRNIKMVADNRKCQTVALIERYQSRIDRVNAVRKRNPTGSSIHTILF